MKLLLWITERDRDAVSACTPKAKIALCDNQYTLPEYPRVEELTYQKTTSGVRGFQEKRISGAGLA